MCGIAGIVLKQPAGFNAGEKIVLMSRAMRHRGPDGEGFVVGDFKTCVPYSGEISQTFTRRDLPYLPKNNINTFETNCGFLFAHRRLAIIDLSESGHQPMCSADSKLWITFNGEIYNYIELREDLKTKGHAFLSESDTEVVIAAYKQWGTACVEKFNGMWAFCIFDSEKQIYFASRDRLGVKPFYYLNTPELFAFASEQKAFVKAGLVTAGIDTKALHNYLVNGVLEAEEQNFFNHITELWPGTNLIYDPSKNYVSTHSYFHLKNHLTLTNDNLSEPELIEKINHNLEMAVKLRLRSDVEVGVCLSGGIDSSALAVIISELTGKPLHCFTSVFRNQLFNEEKFADRVTSKIKSNHLKTEPTLEGFLLEVDNLVYSQDVPIWDTSTYAQFKVMALAKEAHVKVVLDGQGADELFGGYHHHFIAKWNNLLKQGLVLNAFKDMKASGKTIGQPFLFFAKERIKKNYHVNRGHLELLLNDAFIKSHPVKNPTLYFSDLNEQLLSDIYDTRLKSFLKCEDRCGMWHSVESRTPFSDDIELIELLFSFNANKKIKNGVSKYLLREAVKDRLPFEIYSRYDKKGFETPMQKWMIEMRPRVLSAIKNENFDFVNYANLERSNPNNVFQNKLLFKLFILSRWNKVFGAV